MTSGPPHWWTRIAFTGAERLASMCAGAQGEVDGLGPGLKIGRAECRFVGESRLFHLAPYQLYAKRIDIERKRIDLDPVSLHGLHSQPDRARFAIVRGGHRLDIIVDDILVAQEQRDEI